MAAALLIASSLGACGPRVRDAGAPTSKPSAAGRAKGFVCAEQSIDPSAVEPLDAAAASVVRVEVRGSAIAKEICDAIQSRVGRSVNEASVEGDIRRIWALGKVDDVVVARETIRGGVALAYEIVDRKRFGSARIDGVRTADIGDDIDYVPDPGPLDPVAISAASSKLAHALSDQGFRHATISTRTETKSDDTLELVFDVNLGVRSLVKSITFPGADPGRAAEVQRLLVTHVGAPVMAEALERDLLVTSAYYYDHGMLAVQVHPADITESSGGEALDIAIAVDEGPIYRLGTVRFAGDLLDREEDYKKRFWSSAPGSIFNRAAIVADLERIRDYHQSQGFAADVDPQMDLKPDKKIVDVTLRVKKR
jgi:outer membrane protein insertion porin family